VEPADEFAIELKRKQSQEPPKLMQVVVLCSELELDTGKMGGKLALELVKLDIPSEIAT